MDRYKNYPTQWEEKTAQTAQQYSEIEDYVRSFSALFQNLKREINKVVIGQEEMLEGLMIGLLCGGHVLLEGVPGLAKTLAVRTLSTALNLEFRRIQFTPDLLPADLIGTLIFDQRRGDFIPKLGPIFANIILADEINRAPAKVQSALLEAMEERQVTIGEQSYQLPHPFFVMATQNPLEQEGTYSLPEAQIDRFILKIILQYPRRDEERQIIELAEIERPQISPVLSREQIISAQSLVKRIYLADNLKEYILDLITASRPGTPLPDRIPPEVQSKIEELREFVDFGISPRGTLSLAISARAKALLEGRNYVIPDDIRSVAIPVLQHRLILSYRAEAEGLSPQQWLREIFALIPN